MSKCAIGALATPPAGSSRGHFTKNGMCTPPSKKVIFQPR
jgi:hypothetical protein